MHIKFLAHGTGSGAHASAYLMGPHDHTGEPRAGVAVLRGDPVLFCGVGLLIGSWFGMSWIWDQIEQDMGTLRTLRQEIIIAQSTLDGLPKGVSYVKGKDGKGYILSRKMGRPYKTEAGEMAVEVR